MKPTISYAITVCNEVDELEKLLEQLVLIVNEGDEIILQLDTKSTDEVKNLANRYNIGKFKCDYHRIFFPLNKDFASFKNNLKQHCTREYILFLDADEELSVNFLDGLLYEVLEENPSIELFLLPRINMVRGITHEHIKKWGWVVDEREFINYPDYQSRLIKNLKTINWVGLVHERIEGYRVMSALPGFDLIHIKSIIKQEKQNELYGSI